ncbi:MAG: S8 family serine peptidase, partial [Bdellovibrionales bacterium]|nr:S8 family serine peptidase [Bdellovibrionales bacterium]
MNQPMNNDINALEAWDIHTGTHGAGAPIVAVIDTGVDYNHPDLAANMWINPNEIAGNGIDDDGNGYVDDVRGYDFHNNDSNPMDDNSHGTHCAGTIGGVGNNARGV